MDIKDIQVGTEYQLRDSRVLEGNDEKFKEFPAGTRVMAGAVVMNVLSVTGISWSAVLVSTLHGIEIYTGMVGASMLEEV